MKRLVLATTLALVLALSASGVATAISANISPSTQSHAHGVSSSWALTWSGAQPFSVYFWYDVLTNDPPYWHISGTSTTSKSLSTAFYPCVGKTFKQELDVYDQLGFAATTSHATEAGGSPC